MALPGMKSTADFATDERPKNYREGLLRLEPRAGASLYRLTAAMSSEMTDDPEFSWWEEEQEQYVFTVDGAQTNAETAIEIDAKGIRLKPGDNLRVASSGEVIRVVSVASDTVINVLRATGPGGSAAGTAQAIADDDVLLYIGSAYREGAPRAIGVSHNPVKNTNLTQIFRDPVSITRTAQKTKYRTGDPSANDKKRAMHKHALGIERALWLGTQSETLEAGQPIRTTAGVLDFIPPSNVKTVQGAAGAIDMDEWESYFPEMFAYGSGEKLGYTSLAVIMALQSMVRKNSHYSFEQGQKELGMNVTRFMSPAGVIVLTEHPAFGQGGGFLSDSLVLLDTANLRYRYITDTTFLKDRGDNGEDGRTDEYLTECGLEVHHGKSHFWLKGIKSGIKDD